MQRDNELFLDVRSRALGCKRRHSTLWRRFCTLVTSDSDRAQNVALSLWYAPVSMVLACVCSCRQGDPQSQAAMWQQAFFKLAAAAGVPVDPSQGQPPQAVIEQAQAARHRDPWVQVRRQLLHMYSFSPVGAHASTPACIRLFSFQQQWCLGWGHMLWVQVCTADQ